MECPNCGGNIGRFELSPDCKHCGVNLFYSQQEALLSADAKRSELENASFRILAAKLKTAFIKWPFTLLKLIFAAGGIAVFVIPFAKVQFSLPLFENSVSFWAYGLYQGFADGTLLALFDFAKVEPTASIAVAGIGTLAAVLLLLVAELVVMALEVLSFLNIQKFTKMMIPASIAGMVASAAAGVCTFVLKGYSDAVMTYTPGFAPWAALLLFAAVLVLSILVVRKGIEPEIREVDLQRVAMNKRVRKGEVTLESLPLPVFETPEEYQERMRIIEEAEAEEGGGTDG